MLVLDAFNSGSIPVHLLTREALRLYLAHLEPEHGILALHVSNRFLDLGALVAALARDAGLAMALSHREAPGEWSSTWALLARKPDALPLPVSDVTASAVVWRDDYSNLVALLRVRSGIRAAESAAAIELEAAALDPAR